MEDDDELQRIYDSYKKGEMLTGELKAICIKYLQDYVKEFQDLRSKATDETVDAFWAVRPLNDCTGNPKAPVALPIRAKAPAAGSAGEHGGDNGAAGDGKLSKSQLKKIEKEKQIAAKKAAKAAEKEAAATAKTES